MSKFLDVRDLYGSYRRVQGLGRTLERMTPELFDTWLYGTYSKEKLQQYELLKQIPVVSQYMDYRLDVRSDEEYLRRYGMDYSDIHDPRKLRQTSSGSALYGATLNFVSSNVNRLYR